MDKNASGTVFNVQKFSVHDGKGIRTLVFLKGCPLRCRWCSNPESQKMEPERAFNSMRCLTAEVCGFCIKSCPNAAIAVENGLMRHDRSKCVDCFNCATVCPSGARMVYGEAWTVDRVLNRVEEDAVFYARSGGGLTLSGGEAMCQPDFVLALLREARARRIKTAMETCGHYPYEPLREACGLLSELIFDLKSMDAAKHKEFTGVDNSLILKNFQRVCSDFPDLPMLVRTPVISGFNDTPEDITAIRNALPKKGNVRYELLPYHRMGLPKYEYTGRRCSYDGGVPDEKIMEKLNALVRDF